MCQAANLTMSIFACDCCPIVTPRTPSGVRGVGAGGRPRLEKFRANSVFRARSRFSKILKDKKHFNKKIPGQILFFRASALFKILNDKKYIVNRVNSGHNLFFRARTSCSKDKKFFSTVKNSRADSVFQGKRRLFKILNDKKYIVNRVNSGHTLFFRARTSCSKILNVKL